MLLLGFCFRPFFLVSPLQRCAVLCRLLLIPFSTCSCCWFWRCVANCGGVQYSTLCRLQSQAADSSPCPTITQETDERTNERIAQTDQHHLSILPVVLRETSQHSNRSKSKTCCETVAIVDDHTAVNSCLISSSHDKNAEHATRKENPRKVARSLDK
jgi:hypothetical protein